MTVNAESTKIDRLQQVSESKDLSQLVRSNTVHYWTTMKNDLDLRGLGPYLGYEGILAGDPHAGNFAALPLRKIGGSRKMRYVNVDFDDAGRGPFVLDFIRFVVATKATDKKVKRRSLEKAYLKGLAGKEIDPPEKVRKLLEMPASEYDAMAAEYLRKRCSATGFVFKQGEIEPYGAKIDRACIERVFPQTRVIDIGLRPEERGGSAGELRIWVLVEAADRRRRIMELKQYEEPATAKYQLQPAPRQRLKKILLVFWPQLDGSDYKLVTVHGAGLFWIREKRVSLIDVPYSSQEAKKLDFLDELEIYDANQLGLSHGRQSGANRYRRAIKADPEAFHKATKPVEKAYLDIAAKAFRTK